MKTSILLAVLTAGSLTAGEPADRLSALLRDSRAAAAQGDVFTAKSLSLQALAIDPGNIAARVILEKTDAPPPRVPAFRRLLAGELQEREFAFGWMYPTLPPKRLNVPDRVNSK